MSSSIEDNQRNYALPWGYWLIEGIGGAGVTDEAGRRWQSARHCLWQSRLGMPDVPPGQMDRMLDYILMLLSIIDRYVVGPEESLRDIHYSGALDADFMHLWMQARGLYTASANLFESAKLTPEGRSIMLMLSATYTADRHAPPVGLGWINPRQSPHHGQDHERLERLIAEHEVFAKNFDARFERRMIARSPAVVLICLGHSGRLPMQKVVWSLDFKEPFARDRFYIWLLSRIDRWKRWSELALWQGPRAFSDHLMQLAFCDMLPVADAKPDAGADAEGGA